jgi:hypothetical protein
MALVFELYPPDPAAELIFAQIGSTGRRDLVRKVGQRWPELSRGEIADAFWQAMGRICTTAGIGGAMTGTHRKRRWLNRKGEEIIAWQADHREPHWPSLRRFEEASAVHRGPRPQ